MSKIRPVVLAVLLAAPAGWALASILSDTHTQEAIVATSDQVNTYELMSSSKNLPILTYETY
jgi:hypothetical protein